MSEREVRKHSTMNDAPEKPVSPDQELIVAYLDGELDASEAERVEQRLARDESFRLLLREMQEAWDLLDDLPQVTLDEKFTQTTVEMVALRLTEDQGQTDARLRRFQRGQRIALWGGLVACGALAFLAVRQWRSAQDIQLSRDLPVIERIDQYQQLDSLEFLQELAQSNVFDTDFSAEVPNDGR